MLREDSTPTQPESSTFEKQEAATEIPESVAYLEEAQTILIDLNQIFLRLANKSFLQTHDLFDCLTKLDSLMDDRSPKADFDVLFIQIRAKIKVFKHNFTVHESSVSNLCDHVISRIDEFVEG